MLYLASSRSLFMFIPANADSAIPQVLNHALEILFSFLPMAGFGLLLVLFLWEIPRLHAKSAPVRGICAIAYPVGGGLIVALPWFFLSVSYFLFLVPSLVCMGPVTLLLSAFDRIGFEHAWTIFGATTIEYFMYILVYLLLPANRARLHARYWFTLVVLHLAIFAWFLISFAVVAE